MPQRFGHVVIAEGLLDSTPPPPRDLLTPDGLRYDEWSVGDTTGIVGIEEHDGRVRVQVREPLELGRGERPGNT